MNSRPSPLYCDVEPERAQNTDAVGLDGNAAAFGTPLGAAFNQLHRETVTAQCAPERKPGDPASDNQHCCDVGHVAPRQVVFAGEVYRN